MSLWNYVAVWNDAEGEYSLHEEYTGALEDGKSRSWTERPVTVSAETPEDLAEMLESAARDVRSFPPIREPVDNGDDMIGQYGE